MSGDRRFLTHCFAPDYGVAIAHGLEARRSATGCLFGLSGGLAIGLAIGHPRSRARGYLPI